jgi:hypothetical protein
MDKTNELRLARIKNLKESAEKIANVLMEQNQKYKELNEFLNLPEK